MTFDEAYETSRRLCNEGKFEQARPIAEQALRTLEERVDPADMRTHNLRKDEWIWASGCNRGVGETGKACFLIQRALRVAEKVHGPDHREAALTVHNLAILFGEKFEYDRAIQLQRRAARIYKKSLRADHPTVATSLSLQAQCLAGKGDYGEIEQLLRRVMQIREKAFGLEHPVTADACKNLAWFLLFVRKRRSHADANY